ncbi:MAG: chemotaxis protein CheW [Acidobacteria bacterium]|nr:chemotaxis protein CheW [Acidobacteriota bacterium]
MDTDGKSLIFRVGVVELAVGDRDVGSILPDPKVLPVPEMGDGVTGLLPVCGAPRYVLDLRVKFGVAASTRRPVGIVLNRYPVVLMVDTVLDLVRIEAADVRRVPKHPGLYRKYVTGVWRGRSRPCFLLNLEAVMPEELTVTRSPLADLSVRHSVPRLR